MKLSNRNRPRPSRRRPWRWAAIAVLVALVGGLFIYRQGDFGSRTALATLDARDVHALTFSPRERDTAWFGHHGGVLETRDGGARWRKLGVSGDAMGLAVHPSEPGLIYMAGHDVFQVSRDGGDTWRPVQHDLPGTDIHGFAMSNDGKRLFAFVVGSGVFRSDDGGVKWSQVTSRPPGGMGGIMSLAMGPAPNETLYAGTMESGLFASRDGGQTWSAVAGLSEKVITSIAVDPAGTVYVGSPSGLFRGSDKGGAWTRLPLDEKVGAVAVSPVDPRRVLAVSFNRKVFRSDDGGLTWGGRR